MKKLILLIALVLVSCSKEETPEAEAFTLTKEYLIGSTWSIYSYNGSTDLDACDLQQEITFSESHFIETLSYWGDTFLKENCRTSTFETRYKIENTKLRIEYDGASYFPFFKDKNTLEISTHYPDLKVTKVYKLN